MNSLTRPLMLDFLFRSFRSVPGIGPAVAKKLTGLVGGERLRDLLFHLPIDVIDRRQTPDLPTALNGQMATGLVEIINYTAPPRRGVPARVSCFGMGGFLDLVYFNHAGDWLSKTFRAGEKLAISGRLERYQDKWQIVHPDYVVPADALPTLKRLEPLYPLTAGIGNKSLQGYIQSALKSLRPLPEWHDPPVLKSNRFIAWDASLQRIHHPEKAEDVLPESIYARRLAYDEVLARQLALLLVRAQEKRQQGRSMPLDTDLREKFLSALPFTLTAGQTAALADIDADMTSPQRMVRLVQGDVGSGKTVVAFAALLNAVSNQAQAVMMAPTELLARQHFEAMQPIATACGITIGLVVGGKSKAGQETRDKVADGTIQIVFGTHAVFQDSVRFRDLGLVIIDEQHRFGVDQRLRLTAKGMTPDLLVMTATPIPRTLTLALYGDMDVSLIKDKPANRLPIETRIISDEKMGSIIEGLKRAITDNRQAYWVCPMVNESETIDLAAATEQYETLCQHLGAAQVGLVHGKMPARQKEETLRQFADGRIKVLVSTTVIEVGINVPNASIMVIEHAERFGLSQLHQLRGRVGRGSTKSSCILLYHGRLSKMAQDRLSTLRDTEDGFLIAERDLELRGSGEMLGTAQSGLPRYHLARPEHHADLIAVSHRDAQLHLLRDPDLLTERGQALRVLLFLFEQDIAFQTLHAG